MKNLPWVPFIILLIAGALAIYAGEINRAENEHTRGVANECMPALTKCEQVMLQCGAALEKATDGWKACVQMDSDCQTRTEKAIAGWQACEARGAK